MSGVADKRSVPQQGLTGNVTTAARGARFHVARVEARWQLEQESTGPDTQELRLKRRKLEKKTQQASLRQLLL